MERRLAERRVAITGATGFIGAHVTARLLTGGASVILLGPPLKPGVELPPGDVEWLPDALDAGRGRLAAALERCDALVHLRYVPPPTGGALDRLQAEMDANARATATLLGTAASAGVSFVVFTSTANVYPSSGVNGEDGPIAPTTAYAVTKVVEEELVRAWAADTGRPAAVVRLSTVYGPGEMGHRAIPRFIRAALLGQEIQLEGDGTQQFSPLFVGDAAGAIATAVELGAGGTFNLAGDPRTVGEVADAISRLCGLGSEVRRAPAARARGAPLCDTARARAVLGLRQTPLPDGLREEIAWLRRRLEPAVPPSSRA